MIEENFYGPILTRDLRSPRGHWGQLVARDLLRPRYKITYLQALRARLIRNYGALLALLLVAWVVKVTVHPAVQPTGAGWTGNIAFGPVGGWIVAGFVAAFYLSLLSLLLFVSPVSHPESEWETDVGMGVDEHL